MITNPTSIEAELERMASNIHQDLRPRVVRNFDKTVAAHNCRFTAFSYPGPMADGYAEAAKAFADRFNHESSSGEWDIQCHAQERRLVFLVAHENGDVKPFVCNFWPGHDAHNAAGLASALFYAFSDARKRDAAKVAA